MGKDFIVTFKRGTDRAKEMEQVFGRLQFFVVSAIPMLVELPGFEQPQWVYLLDLNFITTKERILLCLHMSNKFNIPYEEVEKSLEDEGVPILDQDVYLTVLNPQRWL